MAVVSRIDSGSAPQAGSSGRRRWLLVGLVLCAALFITRPVRKPPGGVLPVRAQYVVQISVDGLRADLLRKLIDAEVDSGLSNFKRLVDEGASTFNARTDYTHTNTLPNHSTMLTGRPVMRPAGRSSNIHHGYVNNNMPGSRVTLHNAGDHGSKYIASTFDVAYTYGQSTGLFASKDRFILFEQTYNAANGPANPVHDLDLIDAYINLERGSPGRAAEMNQRFLEMLAERRFNYSFVHYLDPDEAGHKRGWGSAAWIEAVRRVDGYLGELLCVIENDERLAGRTVIILSADHGGKGKNHAETNVQENYTIPFLVWGPGVEAGADLYAINPSTRREPTPAGDDRPDYNASVQPIRNGDAPNLALDLLGLGPIPGSTINVRQDLAVSRAPR